MLWYLFPVNPDTKRPAFTGWQVMSTADEAQWDQWEDAGWWLGIDCEKTGIYVVDADVYKPGGVESEAALQLPETLIQFTPRGGRHHIFRDRDGPTGGTSNRLGPAIDGRGRGNLIVYYGDFNDKPMVDLPEHVKARLSAHDRVHAAVTGAEDLPFNVARARAYLSTATPAIEGEGGNDHTYKTAAALRDLGVSLDTAHALMLEGWNERCDPPWDAAELHEVIEHAWNYAQNEAGAQAVASDPRQRFSAVRDAGLDARDARYRLWSVSEALARPAPSWLFPGLLPARAIGVMYGPQDVGKTWLALDQALHLATGIAGYGAEEREPQDVIYFAGEGFEDLVHARIDAWRAYHQHLPIAALDRFRLLEDFPNVADDADTDLLTKQVVKVGLQPRLLILDTYSRVLAQAGLNENDPLDVMKFVRQAEDLKRGFDCTIMAIGHAGKEIERGVRGSNTLEAAVDFAYEVTANWDVKALQLRCKKMKVAKRFDPLHFEAIPQGESLAIRGITPDAYRALTAVEDQFSPRAIGTALAKLGARSAETAVSDHTLAATLHTPGVSDPEQEVQATLERIGRKLHSMARGRLEQYHSAAGWHLPGA